MIYLLFIDRQQQNSSGSSFKTQAAQAARRFSGGSDIVSRSVPDLSSFGSLRHTDLKISKLKLKFSNRVEIFNPKIEVLKNAAP